MSVDTFIHWQSVRWFVLLGPPCGLAAILVLVMAQYPSDVVHLLPILIVALAYSYFIGAIPAFIASVLFGAALRHGGAAFARCKIYCLLVGVLCGCVGSLVLAPFLERTLVQEFLLLFWISGFGGGVCGLIIGIRGARANTGSRPDVSRGTA